MKVNCGSLTDFLANLQGLSDNEIFRKTVWVQVDFVPLDGKTPGESARTKVEFMAVALADHSQGQYLIEFGLDCGVDYREGGEPELNGTKRADLEEGNLEVYCEERGLTLLPGLLDVS